VFPLSATALFQPFIEQMRRAGKTTGIEIAPEILVRTLDEIDPALAAIKKDGAEAVVLQASLSTQHVADLMLKHRLPAATFPRSFVEVGGLMSYGPEASDVFRRSATFVVKILQGSKPADLPVEQPTKFELVINLKTAKEVGLDLPPTLLALVDEVIE
jgi:putative tryptophan/tyrosine transport system substrate-binding protein